MAKETISLDLLINNSPIELDVPGVGLVKYRMPTREDRLEAEKQAKNHPSWKIMEDIDKISERTICLVLQILEEPKITYEEFKKAREDRMEAITQVVSIDLVKRTEALRDKRSNIVNDFLELMKGRAPGISTGSSNNAASTGS